MSAYTQAFWWRQGFGVIFVVLLSFIWPGFNLGLFLLGWFGAEAVRLFLKSAGR